MPSLFGYTTVSDADLPSYSCDGHWSLSNYFRRVKTATEKVNLRCGLLPNYSCDDNSTLCTNTLGRHCP